MPGQGIVTLSQRSGWTCTVTTMSLKSLSKPGSGSSYPPNARARIVRLLLRLLNVVQEGGINSCILLRVT